MRVTSILTVPASSWAMPCGLVAPCGLPSSTGHRMTLCWPSWKMLTTGPLGILRPDKAGSGLCLAARLLNQHDTDITDFLG